MGEHMHVWQEQLYCCECWQFDLEYLCYRAPRRLAPNPPYDAFIAGGRHDGASN
jgi:hypothetical protein